MGLLGQIKSLLRTGTRVDIHKRYELLREAISGTMSSFYMARDRRTGQIVGVKVLDKEETAALDARFKGLAKPSEGQIAIKLSHPLIVKTLEFGMTTEDQQYVVMEFLEGPGLNSLIIGKSKLLDGKRVTLIRQAAEALAAVHKAGYIHRDICPRNFVATPKAESLKLIDFGLTVPATPQFMQPGNRTGTPNYMAPEIVRRHKTDHRLDIFSFGVTCYELCTFDLPWERGKDGKAALTHDQPPQDIRQRRPQINPRLAQAIMQCLSTDPADRPSLDQFLLMTVGLKHEGEP
jgi:eukaryotic-like serine/threonine-protein kinase